MARFSKNYKTFTKWLKAESRTSQYAKRIINAHARYPFASLKQLRNISEIDFSRIPYSKLTEKQWELRKSALRVENLLKLWKGKGSLTKAAKSEGITMRMVKKHLGNALYKHKGKWRLRSIDHIQRRMHMNSEGKRITVIITNSIDASLIGKYENAVKKSLHGNHSEIKKFKGKYIIDSDGKKHYFETDLQTLRDIDEMQEHPEFDGVYAE